ncbi:MAG: S9 family peptidase [Gemmatimonadaceae bacterium]
MSNLLMPIPPRHAQALGFAVLLAALSAAPSVLYGQRPSAPVAELVPRADTMHGDVRVDNYFYMRDSKHPKVIPYLEAENSYTDAMTKHTAKLQEEIYGEIIGRIKQTDLTVPVRRGPYWYYSRTVEGKQYPIFARKRGSLTAREEIIYDQNKEAERSKFFSLGGFEVSPDHSKLAVLVDTTGYEDFELRVRDLGTKKELADRISRLSFGLAWASDNRTVFYMTPDSAKRGDKVWRHTLGSTRESDVMVFHEPDVLFNVALSRTRSGAHILIGSGSFTSSEWHVIDAARPDSPARLIAKRRPDVEYEVEHAGANFLIRTNVNGQRNFAVMQAPVSEPAPERWTPFIPYTDSVFVENVDAFGDFVLVMQRLGGMRQLVIRSLSGAVPRVVPMDEAAYGVFPGNNPEYRTSTVRYTYSSLVTPPSVYEYNVRSGTRRLLKREDVLGGYDPSRYAVERTYATARDGVRVPVSLVYKKPFSKDAARPLLLYAYGSYGATTEPTFNSQRFSLVDRGFTYAIAHVRGGQEMGRPWYDDGKMLTKKNTFTDFIAVADHLLAEKYTSRDLLVAHGGSAGGLLMGAVANMGGDRFKAIVADVPFVDVINTMQDASIPLTAQEWIQWGNPNIRAEYDYMKSYSPYDNVERKPYPALLVMSGINDSRVAYWEPTKWVAKLRTHKTDGNVLLLKMNMGAGHGGSSGRYERYRETAFRYAFMVDQVKSVMQ